ncbi:MAG: tetratricopeptide repeat protein [Bdellovibrionales bacterium]|nr:tetratricopeptide repeat protein [Bdellovibrionales bacterium]
MMFILALLPLIGFSLDVDIQSARQQFLKDVEDYNFSVDIYVQEATKYRNIKMNEEYRQRITNLEKELIKGNKEVLKTVDSYKAKNKDQILLDDVLLMRLAQLEFEKANFDYNESVTKVNSKLVSPNYTKCLEYTTQLLRQYPESTLADSAEYLIAYIYEEQADFKKADAIYSYFLKKYPVSKYYDEVQWRLAELQFESDNIKEARRNYLALAKRENSKFEFKALYKLGATLFETGLFSWSSKMFVRLYDRLKNDTVSSAERSTLFDETLEYIGLLERKGVALKLDPEIEALSAKKIQQIFARHGLWSESEKVIKDYIAKYPNSKYLPEMYSRWIDIYQQRKLIDNAEDIRTEYFSKLLDDKSWWLENKDNYQERFLAEEQIEVNLVASARYLVSKKRYDLAINRYKSFLDKYPYDPKSVDARVELAEIYYLQKKYSLAYTTVEEMPEIEMSKAQKDNYYFIKLSSYYAANLQRKSKEINTTMSFLTAQYLNNVQNLDRAASIVKPVAEYFSSKKLYAEANDILAKYPYDRIEYSTKTITDLLDAHLKIDRRGNQSRENERLQQTKLDVSLRKMFNLRPFVSKIFRNTYEDLAYYLSVSDIDGFESVQLPNNMTLEDQDVQYIMKAQLYRGMGKFVESNQILADVSTQNLKNYSNFINAKNLYDMVDFAGCAALLAGIKSKNFKAEYPEYYKLRYDLAWITSGPEAASSSSILLAKTLQSDIPVVDHMFRLPVSKRKDYLNSASKGIKGAFVEAYKSKKPCSGTVECTYVTWIKSKSKAGILNDVVDALVQSSDPRWLLGVVADMGADSKLTTNSSVNSKIKEWMQLNQFRFSVAGTYKLTDLLSKWNIRSKDVVIPWDVAMHEWINWQGLASTTGELQILLQEEKYTDLENKLVSLNQRKGLDTGLNLLKYYLFTQNKEKAKQVFDGLHDYIEPNAYGAMSYMFGFSNDYMPSEDSDNSFVIAAKAKQYLSENKIRDSLKLLSSAIQTNPNDKIYYYGLMQSLLLIRDYTAASVVIKRLQRNTGSAFASISDYILNAGSYTKTGIISIDKMADAIANGAEVDIPVNHLSLYVKLARAWLNSTDTDVKNVDSGFDGLTFMYSAISKQKVDSLNNAYFIKSLDKVQRDVASEVEK